MRAVKMLLLGATVSAVLAFSHSVSYYNGFWNGYGFLQCR